MMAQGARGFTEWGWSQAHEVIAGVTVDSMQERCAGYGHDLSKRATISNKSNILAEREHP